MVMEICDVEVQHCWHFPLGKRREDGDFMAGLSCPVTRPGLWIDSTRYVKRPRTLAMATTDSQFEKKKSVSAPGV